MIKLLPQIIFGVSMLALGIMAVFFTTKIYSWMSKGDGESSGFSNLISYTQTIWSIRFGGTMAILIGLFMLWMSWRNV